ncbi:MAG: hypothetical protein GX677_10100 [Treponema sp.]|nr:hypothetical protein [Treponema sp.]
MENAVQDITKAKNTISQLLPLINDAENSFKSARTWGFIDIFGGGLITDLIKHSRLNNASITMNKISYLLQELQSELKTITIPVDYRMQMGGFSTFGDFVFDGAIFDIYMQSKIMQSLEQVRILKGKLEQLNSVLNKI